MPYRSRAGLRRKLNRGSRSVALGSRPPYLDLTGVPLRARPYGTGLYSPHAAPRIRSAVSALRVTIPSRPPREAVTASRSTARKPYPCSTSLNPPSYNPNGVDQASDLADMARRRDA